MNATVSIIVPTCNRLGMLQRCVRAIRATVAIPHELIIVDGASTDGTRQWLANQDGLLTVFEPAREGPTKAVNRGFRVASGDYVMWLNDDAELFPGAVQAAVQMLERPDLQDVGMVGFYHTMRQERNRLDEVTIDGETYGFFNVRGFPYANFGLIRRPLLEKIGYADEAYFSFGWDPDLSLKVQLEAGLKVIGCRGALVRHAEHDDDRRIFDVNHHFQQSNERLFKKWNLPEKNSYPDPRPAYQALIQQRQLV